MNDFDYLAQLPGEEREQNWIKTRLKTLSVREGIILAAASQADQPKDAVQAINQLQSLDVYRIVCGADSYERLGEYYLAQCRGVPDDVKPYVDLAQVGKHYTVLHPGRFLDGCYVAYPDVKFTPAYQGQGAPLPNDGNWTVKLKIASPSLPEGVWMRLPWEDGLGDKTSIEEEVTLNALHAQSWAECALLDARCVLPEAGDLMEQYSDVEELIRDGLSLADALWWPLGEDTPWYPAALRLEHCQNLKLALDISRNPDCYHWLPRVDLEASAKEALTQAGVSEKITQSGGVGLRSYGAHLLEKQRYTLTADGGGYIARTAQEFHYSHSTPAPEQSGMVMQ